MTSELQVMLGQADGSRQLERWFGGALVAGDFAGLDAFLRDEMAAHPDPVSSACLRIAPSDVSIIGWEEFFADYAAELRRSAAMGPITAIGLDLTMHCDPDGDDWGAGEQFYDDGSFAFSSGDVAAINAAAQGGSTPWQGCFRDLSNSLSLRGLGRLYAMLADREGEHCDYGQPASVASAAYQLGWLFLTLRFHQAIKAAIATVGLPVPMIVIGGSHDVRPYVDAAYWCDKIAEPHGRSQEILDARDKANKDRYRRDTDEMINEWRDRRNAIVRNQLRQDKRQQWIEYCEARDASLRNLLELGEGPPVHLLSDHDFELLLYRVRMNRAVRIGDDPDSVTPPPARKTGLFSLFRRAA